MSADLSQTQLFQSRDQFRMCRLQVFNWGTFERLHTIPIAEKGFLFVGRSGSGKTTLLDAFSALLVPPKWVNFNAAAQEIERRGRDRNLTTYIRGAWAEQKDGGSGEVVTQYLRKGTTWSALGLMFQHTNGRLLTLVQVFWIRGNASGIADVHRHFIIFEREFDLKELSDFDLDLRRLKQTFADAHHFGQFNPYCERFRRLLDIDNEMALRLLHKTQSAKNLGDLNTFLREFMLDRPETFNAAEMLVKEFGELNDAHVAVVTAREQVQTLIPARKDHKRFEEVRAERDRLDALRLAVDPFREARRMTLLEERLAKLAVRAEGLAGEIRVVKDTLDNHRHNLLDLEEEHRQLGGDRIERFEAERRQLREQHAERLRKRNQAQEACNGLGWYMPSTPQGFAELTDRARSELDDWQHRAESVREKLVDLSTAKRDKEKEFVETRKEVDALLRQPSNIPAQMLELRSNIASALKLDESSLPFVGELLEVKLEENAWRGSIERVLHGFALSLLVEERDYPALSNYLNETHLGGRVVYYKTTSPSGTGGTPGMISLIRKLRVKDTQHRLWLEEELYRRFDYACVDSIRAFRQEDRALTQAGQVKHNRNRHEKDDRHDVNDQRFWVLGFDNRDKRSIFQTLLQELAVQISNLTDEINTLHNDDESGRKRAMFSQTLGNMQWQEVDVASLNDRLRDIAQHLEQLRHGNAALDEAGRRLEALRTQIEKVEDSLRKKCVEEERVGEEAKSHTEKLDALRSSAEGYRLNENENQDLQERLEALGQAIGLDNLDRQMGLVERRLSDEITSLEKERNLLEKRIEQCFAEFKRRWPMEAGDVDATLASASDFLAKLIRLEIDGLPSHEKRFFDLLQTQSHQNLAALGTHLQQAQREIRDRMELVNESLAETEFNKGTFLRIEVSDRLLPEVVEFKQMIRQSLSHAFEADREISEQRFLIIRELVNRLSSQETVEKRWQESVLDVRQHVEFIGRELDQDGREIEVYRSGAGKSGGQRQKLATTCLAAALRYQLGGSDHELPVYAPVVLDEAFDKADNEFTALAMNIFKNFGFQMIVATPLKSVMTLEPFIGGACFIDIGDRQRSSVLLIEYDEERQRLDLPEQSHGGTPVAVS